MKGTLIVFRLSKKNTILKFNKFCRDFYGYIDRSNRGGYTYKRPGYLDGFPHVKIIRGVIIVRTKDRDDILIFLRKYNAEVYDWPISVSGKHSEILKGG